MSWKNFFILKDTSLIIFVLLATIFVPLFLLVFFLSMGEGFFDGISSAGILLFLIVNLPLLLFYLAQSFFSSLGFRLREFLDFIPVFFVVLPVLQIVYLYLLSCVGSFLVRKFKNTGKAIIALFVLCLLLLSVIEVVTPKPKYTGRVGPISASRSRCASIGVELTNFTELYDNVSDASGSLKISEYSNGKKEHICWNQEFHASEEETCIIDITDNEDDCILLYSNQTHCLLKAKENCW